MTAAAGVVISAAHGRGPFGITSKAWQKVPETMLALAPTPLDVQPSAYVRKAFESRAYGTLERVHVAAAVDAHRLWLRLHWLAPDARPGITDNNVYADACAVLFPADGAGAELATMGDDARPVEGWHWRAGTEMPFVIEARGLGTVTRQPRHAVTAEAHWDAGEWTVVLSRPLTGEGVPLAGRSRVPIAVAVWMGARQERAGLKSHTPEWASLALPG